MCFIQRLCLNSRCIFTSFFLVTCMQRIDGFLAVLSIAGGNFSPQSQKLPFAVTSVEGDNYLLYYSSIDLARHTSTNKSRGAQMKRSLSIGNSQGEKSRLRVPMKGRIQLVMLLSIENLPDQSIILFSNTIG